MPALDGMRALAIAGVLGVHLDRAKGGYLGVTLFFVLSGFLITSLLLAERAATSRIDLRAFYWRRAARLLPPMVVALAGTILVDYHFHADRRSNLVLGAATSLLYVSNWAATITNRFLGLFNPTWSLGQEEQFYLLAPFLLRRLQKGSAVKVARTLLGVTVVLMVARAILMQLFPHGYVSTYHNPLLNMDALALGTALALLLSRPGAGLPKSLASASSALLALVAVGLCFLTVGGTGNGIALGIPLTAVAASLLILNFVGNPDGAASRVASWAPLVWVGRRSYTMYLVQVPVIYLFRRHVGGSGHAPRYLWQAGALAVVVVLAAASYPVEQRIRQQVRERHRHHEPDAVGREG